MLTNKLTGAGSAAEKTYVEDVFSTTLYTGKGVSTHIATGVNTGGAPQSVAFSTSTVVNASYEVYGIAANSSGLFVAIVGAGGSAYATRSTDGVTWSTAALLNGYTGTFNVRSLSVNSAGLFVAFGDNSAWGMFSTSSDGITWTTPAYFAGGNKYLPQGSAAYGTKLVGVGYELNTGYNMGYYFTTTDGVNWSLGFLGGYSTTNYAAFDSVAVNSSGKFVAIGSSPAAKYSTSTNGTTWSAPATTGQNVIETCMACSPTTGLFVAIGKDPYNPSTGYLMTSTNGTTWSTRVAAWPDKHNFKSVAVNSSGLFVAIGYQTDTFAPVFSSSTDGTTWTVPKSLSGSMTAVQSKIGVSSTGVFIAGTGGTLSKSVDTPAVAAPGGLVWIKGRSGATDHALYDTARGATYDLVSNSTAAQTTQSTGIAKFSDFGFSIGALAKVNTSAATYASWTFRKAPKFFDVVTFTYDPAVGYPGKTVAHNLGATPGMIIVKSTTLGTGGGASWYVGHRATATPYVDTLFLSSTAAASAGNSNINNVTSTSFSFFGGGTSGVTETYVAYLFAHDTTTDGLIQCGSVTLDGTSTYQDVNLGWEPQFVLTKNASSLSNWFINDNMRGMPVDSNSNLLFPNTSGAEGSSNVTRPTATGFKINNVLGVNATYIYMAIRRPMKVPTDGTKVFQSVADTQSSGTVRTIGFPADLAVSTGRTTNIGHLFNDRLRGFSSTNTAFSPRLYSAQTSAETSSYAGVGAVTNTGYQDGDFFDPGISMIRYLFKRAPGFFDVVCYTGTSGVKTVNHNLGVAPELMIVKRRSNISSDSYGNWRVYSSALGATQNLVLNLTNAPGASSLIWNDTTPTSSVFTAGTYTDVNSSGNTYVAYLFASCPGVSKVGSYTGNGSSQTINCGFAAGARFVLIKRTDSTGDWYVWDTARGIVAGNDPHLSLNTLAAEVTTNDTIDPDSTGFIVNQVSATNVNVNAASYIYLAIA